MRSTRLWTIVVIVTVVATAIAFTACGGPPGTSGVGPAVQFLEPGDFNAADYAGKPLVVNFFGSWCGPCNAEAPELAEFAKAHPEAQFVGVAVDDSEGDITSFMNEYGLTYPVVVDDDSLATKYGITGVPETFFFGAGGGQKDHIIGSASRDRFEAGLAAAQ
ncbi:MAG: TlpA disulfide reductase family protein [Thermoleophilia bacterium]